jgi:hypothetical protein
MQMRAIPTPRAALAPTLKLSPRAPRSCESTVALARAAKRDVVEKGCNGWRLSAVRWSGDRKKVSPAWRQSPEREPSSNQQGSSSDAKFSVTMALPLNGLTLSSLNSGWDGQFDRPGT